MGLMMFLREFISGGLIHKRINKDDEAPATEDSHELKEIRHVTEDVQEGLRGLRSVADRLSSYADGSVERQQAHTRQLERHSEQLAEITAILRERK